MSSPNTSSTKKSGFRLTNVLLIVVPVAVLMFGGVYAWFNLGLGEKLRNAFGPSLAAARGKVTIEDEPLVGARIRFKPETEGLQLGESLTDENGEFSIHTELAGNALEGAYKGKHKVVVVLRGQPRGIGAPPLLTPEEYSAFDSTPLLVEVSSSADKNYFEFKLKGELLEDPSLSGGGQAASGGRGGGGAPGGGGGRGGGGAPGGGGGDRSGQMVNYFQNLDTDKDGKLSMQEMENTTGEFRNRLMSADENEDQHVDRAEFFRALGMQDSGQ